MGEPVQADIFSREVVPDEKKPGRPAGAVNKKTLATAQKVRQHTDPLVNIALVARQPIKAIASQLGMKVADAAKFWLDCQKELNKFTYSPMPTAVHHTGMPIAMVSMQIGEAVNDPTGPLIPALNPVKTIGYDDDAETVAGEGVAQND